MLIRLEIIGWGAVALLAALAACSPRKDLGRTLGAGGGGGEGGESSASCGTSLTECDGACRDLEADRENCGSCGNVCAAGELCSAGECTPSSLVTSSQLTGSRRLSSGAA